MDVGAQVSHPAHTLVLPRSMYIRKTLHIPKPALLISDRIWVEFDSSLQLGRHNTSDNDFQAYKTLVNAKHIINEVFSVCLCVFCQL